MDDAPAAPKPCCVCDAPNGKHCTKCKSRHGKKCQLVRLERGRAQGAVQAAGHRVLGPVPRRADAGKEAQGGAGRRRGRRAGSWLRGIEALICCSSDVGQRQRAERRNAGLARHLRHLDLLPVEPKRQVFYSCCCKRLCLECAYKCEYDERCPLCRAPIHKSDAEALRRLQKHVDKGNADAQVMLGDAYCNGQAGLKKSLKRALQLYERAAAQGNVRGHVQLGDCYRLGNGFNINYKTAALWYRRAAEQGYPDAQCNLAAMFHKGKGVAQSNEEAVKWYRLAAAQGHADALYELGACHANDQGVPQDDEALRLYKRAAAQGSAEAPALVRGLEACRE